MLPAAEKVEMELVLTSSTSTLSPAGNFFSALYYKL
jgi:hypothetical protein